MKKKIFKYIKDLLIVILLASTVTLCFVIKVHVISYLNTEQYYQAVADIKNIKEKEVIEMPFDPWGNKYKVIAANEIVYSFGADQIDNGGDGDDIVGHEKRYDCSTYGVDCNYPSIHMIFIIANLFFGISLGGFRFFLGMRKARIRKINELKGSK